MTLSLDEPLSIGDMLGPYQLIRRLAFGGMAEIWKAKGTLPDGNVGLIAVKLIQALHLDDPEYISMYRDEVKLSQRLRHEHVVRTYCELEFEGRYGQSMELIDGLDLRRLMIQAKQEHQIIPLSLVLYIGRCVAKGLAYVHARRSEKGRLLKIIHRDISPHNIMVGAAGQVKVLDFGIAKTRWRQAQTRAGIVKGKIGYMSPEQTLGRNLDFRSDIFSLGIVLWELLVGRPLFRGIDAAAVLSKIQRVELPRLDGPKGRKELPLAIIILVHQMLSQNPEQRPANMLEVERRLTREMMRSFQPHEYGPRALESWLGKLGQKRERKVTLLNRVRQNTAESI